MKHLLPRSHKQYLLNLGESRGKKAERAVLCSNIKLHLKGQKDYIPGGLLTVCLGRNTYPTPLIAPSGSCPFLVFNKAVCMHETSLSSNSSQNSRDTNGSGGMSGLSISLFHCGIWQWFAVVHRTEEMPHIINVF